jgi:hypothetical protein
MEASMTFGFYQHKTHSQKRAEQIEAGQVFAKDIQYDTKVNILMDQFLLLVDSTEARFWQLTHPCGRFGQIHLSKVNHNF